MLFLTRHNESQLCGRTACISGEELIITLLMLVVVFILFKIIYKK